MRIAGWVVAASCGALLALASSAACAQDEAAPVEREEVQPVEPETPPVEAAEAAPEEPESAEAPERESTRPTGEGFWLAPPQPPVYETWWFWTAIGMVALGISLSIAIGVTTDHPRSSTAGLVLGF